MFGKKSDKIFLIFSFSVRKWEFLVSGLPFSLRVILTHLARFCQFVGIFIIIRFGYNP